MGQPADGIATEEWGAGGALSRPRLCRSIQCNTRQAVRLDNSCNSPRAPDRGTVYTVPWRRIVIVGYSWYTLPAAFPLNLAPAFVLAIPYQAAIMSASTASLDIAVAPGLASPVPQLPQRKKAAVATPAKKTTPSAGVSLLSGAIAGGVEATITYPFEFAKTRAQLQSSAGGSKNPFTAIAQVARSDGVGAIYTGCSTLILGTAFKAGVRFLSFDAIRVRLADERGVLSPGRGILAGMMAGAVESVAAVTPTERIKTALIDDAKSSQRRFRGGMDATRSILAAQGLPGLYRGLISTTMKQSATSAVRMGSYNVLKEASRKHSLPQNSGTTFAIGALAGTVTVYATQPFDTIKTRAQSAAGASTGEAFRSVLLQNGIRGFWSGSTMRLGRLVFSGGIVFTVYEKIAALLTKPQ